MCAAWHLHVQRPCAVKFLHPQFVGNPELRARFRREAQSACVRKDQTACGSSGGYSDRRVKGIGFSLSEEEMEEVYARECARN